VDEQPTIGFDRDEYGPEEKLLDWEARIMSAGCTSRTAHKRMAESFRRRRLDPLAVKGVKKDLQAEEAIMCRGPRE
jgi:hypothetical protein